VAEIGVLHCSTPDSIGPVREWVARPDLWQRSRISHEDLTAAILAADGIICQYALRARTGLEGARLEDGVHCWTVAVELGIDIVPVEMRTENESPWAWPVGVFG